MAHIKRSLIILLIMLTPLVAEGQSKRHRVLLYHQSTGGNYYNNINTLTCGTGSQTMLTQLPIYNRTNSITSIDTAVYDHKGALSTADGPSNSQTYWNNWHHAFDNDPGWTNSFTMFRTDTASYGVINVKTCFSWEAGQQSATPDYSAYTDEQFEAIRQTAHNYWTSKWHIRNIIKRMGEMNTVIWVLWTMPPGPQNNNDVLSMQDLRLARWMADTLANNWDPVIGGMPGNVRIFDLFRLTADSKGELPTMYACDTNPSGNSHPGTLGITTFAPQILTQTLDLGLKTSMKNPQLEYPRIAGLQWAGGVPEWVGNFDLWITKTADSTMLKATKLLGAKQRDSLFMLFTYDYNAGAPWSSGSANPIDTAWRYRTADYQWIPYVGAYMADVSNWCAPLTTRYGSQRYNEAQGDTLAAILANPLWDGANSDGTWPIQFNTTIDWDRDGLLEVGTEDQRQWATENGTKVGYNTIYNKIRAKRGAEKGLTWWTINTHSLYDAYRADTMGIALINGCAAENFPIQSMMSFDYLLGQPQEYFAGKEHMDFWNSSARKFSPLLAYHCFSTEADADINSPTGDSRTNYRDIRYALGFCMYQGSFFMVNPSAINVSTDHLTSDLYDEMTASLGFPSGEWKKIRTTSPVDSFWVGFFSKGAYLWYPYANRANYLVNVTSFDDTVGYAGPYYRMYGNQDPIFNNGELFDTVTFHSHTYNSLMFGDGLMLFKVSDTVAMDIVLAPGDFNSTPGAGTYIRTGTWTNDFAQSGFYWPATLLWGKLFREYADNPRTLRNYYATGTGNYCTAIPDINIAGEWSVYEWHGFRGSNLASATESNDVMLRIRYSGGYEDKVLNLTQGIGMWNLLGTYTFDPGDSMYVRFWSDATGETITPAFKFVLGQASEQPVRVATSLYFTQCPTAVVEDATFIPPILVQVRDQYGNLISDTRNVTLAIGSGSGALGGTLIQAAVGGIATFSNISINNPGTYTLTASATGLSGATSPSIVISSVVVPSTNKKLFKRKGS